MSTARLFAIVGLVSFGAGFGMGELGCKASSTPSSTRTTSAQAPHAGAGSPALRTVDNAGYVDPGGRTRQVSQGTTVAPAGRGNEVAPLSPEKPTRSSTANTPPPVETPTAAPPSQITAGPEPATPASSDVGEFRERASRALCDREQVCNRIGPGRAFDSADACVSNKRERVRAALGESPCKEIRGDRASACLGSIRNAQCGIVVQPPSECTKEALCD